MRQKPSDANQTTIPDTMSDHTTIVRPGFLHRMEAAAAVASLKRSFRSWRPGCRVLYDKIKQHSEGLIRGLAINSPAAVSTHAAEIAILVMKVDELYGRKVRGAEQEPFTTGSPSEEPEAENAIVAQRLRKLVDALGLMCGCRNQHELQIVRQYIQSTPLGTRVTPVLDVLAAEYQHRDAKRPA